MNLTKKILCYILSITFMIMTFMLFLIFITVSLIQCSFIFTFLIANYFWSKATGKEIEIIKY